MRRIFFYSIFVFASVSYGCLRFISPGNISSAKYVLIKDYLTLLYGHQLLFAFLFSLIVALNVLLGFVAYPQEFIKKRKRRIVGRIHSELFQGDPNLHRITLFKEINYLQALGHHIYSFFYHMFRCPKKCGLYFRRLPIGRYLVVDERAGGNYKKSTTMFRVEENEIKKCEGIAGLIRLKKAEALLSNLPDIDDINLDSIDIMKSRSNEAKKVREYMADGYVRDFELLRKLHRKARHFYGTIVVNEKGFTWGLLLADSTADRSPFDEITQKRFNSFAITVGDLV